MEQGGSSSIACVSNWRASDYDIAKGLSHTESLRGFHAAVQRQKRKTGRCFGLFWSAKARLLIKKEPTFLDAQRCQNHGPVRLLVPLLEFNGYLAQFE